MAAAARDASARDRAESRGCCAAIASADEDRWADPKGEFLAGLHAQPVFDLFGKKGYGVAEQPGTNAPVGETVRYHLRAGKHDVTRYDWEQYLPFARRAFGL